MRILAKGQQLKPKVLLVPRPQPLLPAPVPRGTAGHGAVTVGSRSPALI